RGTRAERAGSAVAARLAARVRCPARSGWLVLHAEQLVDGRDNRTQKVQLLQQAESSTECRHHLNHCLDDLAPKRALDLRRVETPSAEDAERNLGDQGQAPSHPVEGVEHLTPEWTQPTTIDPDRPVQRVDQRRVW